MWLAIPAQVVLIWTAITVANVEKTIFLAPEALGIPSNQLNLDQLQLEVLTPSATALRRQLRAAFPTPTEPEGPTSWFFLDSLKPSQRYELRVCWLATQPTDFTIITYQLHEVFESPKLISSLAFYTERHKLSSRTQPSTFPYKHSTKSSILFLKINAAAAYFTTNETLMQKVPLVDVDIILDPYLLNILPKSLVPTGIHLTVVAFIAWYLSKAIWTFLDQASSLNVQATNAEIQQKKTS